MREISLTGCVRKIGGQVEFAGVMVLEGLFPLRAIQVDEVFNFGGHARQNNSIQIELTVFSLPKWPRRIRIPGIWISKDSRLRSSKRL